jgi:hypothetical protein
MPNSVPCVSRLLAPLALALSLLGAGCAGTGQMTPQQKEAIELRRYCDQHPDEQAKCLGFLGFH